MPVKCSAKPIGLGAAHSDVCFYIANRPPLDDYPQLQQLRPLASGELAHIVKHTSNHWRKAFNVYAKLLHDWRQQQEGATALPTRW